MSSGDSNQFHVPGMIVTLEKYLKPIVGCFHRMIGKDTSKSVRRWRRKHKRMTGQKDIQFVGKARTCLFATIGTILDAVITTSRVQRL